MKLIRNAICYRIDLPAASLLEHHLAEIRHTDIQPAESEKWGFSPVHIPNSEDSDALVTSFEGGLAFAVRIDEKMLPAGVVNAEVKKRCAAWASEQGLMRAPKAVRKEIKEDVIFEMMQRALVRTSVVTAFYHCKSRFLFVSGTKRQADILTSLLIKAVGAAKTETINVSDVKGGLTTRMRSHLDLGIGFDDAFELESGVWLARGKERVTAQLERVGEARKAIDEALTGGFKVTAVRMTHVDTDVAFKLTTDFHLKGIQGLDAGESSSAEDPAERWAQEAGAQVHMMVSVFNDLCEMFDYQEPVEQEAA